MDMIHVTKHVLIVVVEEFGVNLVVCGQVIVVFLMGHVFVLKKGGIAQWKERFFVGSIPTTST